MSLLTPLALIAGLLAIPIILLYMLRLRRRELTVSSTYLWQQVVRDREANTPWQKLRRNLLLLLQLLILALLVLALARPYITVPAVSAGQIALLLDASASMSATDSGDGTRFAEAQRRADEIVDTLSAGDTMTIIRVADVPEVLAGYTGDAALLRDAIASAQPSSTPADWVAAFTLAAAGAAGAQDFNVVVISDGGIGAASGFPPIPGDIEFVPVGTSADNLAITALAARALPGEPAQLFAEITNYSTSDVEIIFSLSVDGAIFSADRYTIPSRASLPVVSSALPQVYEAVEAQLTLPSGATFRDYLPLDDSAFAVSPTAGARRVLLMTESNRFMEQALLSLPGVQLFMGDLANGIPSDANAYDLIVLDGWLPDALPTGDLLVINPPASTPLFTVGAQTEATTDIRVERGDPRMTYVDFSAVNLLRFREVTASWADALITAEGGALLLAGESDGRQVAILTFDLRDSDLPLQIAFPILIASLLEWYAPENVIREPALAVGAPVAIQPPLDALSLRVTLPNGEARDLALTSAPTFAETTQPGLYVLEVARTGDVTDRVPFAVNLFSREESDITPRQTISLGAAEIAPSTEQELGQQEFWSWLALAALAILLIEWYAYHRRQHAPAAFRTLGGRRRATQ
ncbi:MAG: VWA domain-containing protein [Chloroflexota bacterium]|nr:VWA domain-containing protein [Chloroflexota bacterium]